MLLAEGFLGITEVSEEPKARFWILLEFSISHADLDQFEESDHVTRLSQSLTPKSG